MCVFLYGYGGTGKTLIWRALTAALRSKGEIVLTVASSGIAALLIPGGRTAHSRIYIPISVDECSTCSIYPDTHLATLIIKAKLIIWDEAPMMHKHCFEAVDQTLRNVLKSLDEKNKYIPFGGKVVVFGGDFRQILPVIPKDIEERRSFSEWVLGIGNGTIGESDDVDITLDIPSDLLIPTSSDPLGSIVATTYPRLLDSMNDITYFQNRAILAPKNSIVVQINDYVLDLPPGEEKMYLSYDSPYSKNIDGNTVDDVHTPEFLNTITTSGLLNHKLRSKVGVPVMLLRNIDKKLGLCNGTRLIITRMRKFVLEGKVISGSNIGEKVFIPRLSLTPSNVRIRFKFQRRQFSLAFSFAMTRNKSQGQSLKYEYISTDFSVFTWPIVRCNIEGYFMAEFENMCNK